MRLVPQGNEASALRRVIGVGRVQQARIDDKSVPGRHGYIDLLGPTLEFWSLEFFRVAKRMMPVSHEVMDRMSRAVRTGNDAQATIFRSRVDEVVHQRELHGLFGVRRIVLPPVPVEMPEQPGRR